MAFYLNTEISEKKTLVHALQKIYGIGKTASINSCNKIGINPESKLETLPKKKINNLFTHIENFYIVNENLKKKNQQILANKKLLKIKK